MKKAIQIDERDTVATVTSDMEIGEMVEVLSPKGEIISRYQTSCAVPFGHKIALTDFNIGDEIIKYGEIIGVASKTIKTGDWVHTHNVESATVPTSSYKERGP